MRSKRRRSVWLPALLLATTASVAAADWPHWRGPARSGSVTTGLGLEASRAIELDLLWRRPLGSGYSSIAVVDGKAYVSAAIDGFDHVISFDPATGEERWRTALGPIYLGRSGSDDGPSSSPAVDGDLVVALEPDGKVVALDSASGKVRWSLHFERDFGAEPITYGFSTVPLIDGDRVFLLVGGGEGGLLAAVDRETGKPIWRSGSGAVEHQNPTLATLGGRRQIVAPAARSVAGFSLEDGEELWRFELESPTHSGDVVAVDESRLLVSRWPGSHLLEVSREGAAWSVREVWSSGELKGSYSAPIRRGEYLYGFNGRFMSCVSLETGDRVWKSRSPGGPGGQVLLDEHLFVIGGDGALVAVAATPEAYRESGRLPLFQRRVFTPPSYADGTVFVRNLEDMVALRLRAVSAELAVESVPGDAPAQGVLGALLATLEAAKEKESVLDDFFERHPETPIVDGNRIHFLYRGEVEDLAIVGDMTGLLREEPMYRVAGTDLYHRSFHAETDDRWEYRFKVFDDPHLDPRNPRSVEGADGPRSVVVLPGWEEPKPMEPCADCPKGRLEEVVVQSTVPDRAYPMAVYTPPGYDEQTERSYPLMIVAEGKAAREHGRLVATLDRLIGVSVEPLVVAFLELPDGLWWEQSRGRYAEILGQDILPHLEAAYRIRKEPSARAFLAHGWSTGNSLAWVLAAPVGKFAAQSAFLGEYYIDRAVPPLLEGAEPIDLWLDWGRSDAVQPDSGLDVARQSRALGAAFEAAGHAVRLEETPGGANWARYRTRIGELLGAFFPLEDSATF